MTRRPNPVEEGSAHLPEMERKAWTVSAYSSVPGGISTSGCMVTSPSNVPHMVALMAADVALKVAQGHTYGAIDVLGICYIERALEKWPALAYELEHYEVAIAPSDVVVPLRVGERTHVVDWLILSEIPLGEPTMGPGIERSTLGGGSHLAIWYDEEDTPIGCVLDEPYKDGYAVQWFEGTFYSQYASIPYPTLPPTKEETAAIQAALEN